MPCRGALAALQKTVYGTSGWTDDDVLMNSINCMGYESMVQMCQYQAITFCPVSEVASVMCRENTGTQLTSNFGCTATFVNTNLHSVFIFSILVCTVGGNKFR